MFVLWLSRIKTRLLAFKLFPLLPLAVVCLFSLGLLVPNLRSGLRPVSYTQVTTLARPDYNSGVLALIKNPNTFSSVSVTSPLTYKKTVARKPSSNTLALITPDFKTGLLSLIRRGDVFLADPAPKPVVAAKKAPVPLGPAQSVPGFSEYPAWAQNFAAMTSTTPSSTDWNIDIGPPNNVNNEAEYYTNSPTNLHIKNGTLSLEATQQAEPQGYGYASARIDTQNKQSFLYGRIDITAQVPIGVGLWPAAWFLPANNTYADLSPPSDSLRYMNGGEIDLMEEVGFLPNTEYGIVHTLADASNPNGVGSYSTVQVPNGQNSYNVYTLLWTPSSITFEVNSQPFYTYARPAGSSYVNWPFDQPFYLILNLAVGGSWGGEDNTAFTVNGIDNSVLPSSLNIKSIYYYPYNGS